LVEPAVAVFQPAHEDSRFFQQFTANSYQTLHYHLEDNNLNIHNCQNLIPPRHMYILIPERWRSTCMSGILIRAIYAVILAITDVCFEDTLRTVTFEKT
jgi:hypothetical protein